MKIAILGAGRVGGALGRAWASTGHEVIFGVRDSSSQKVVELLDELKPRASATSLRAAAASSGVVVLATPWAATLEAVEAAGDLADKVVLDATNPLTPDLSGLITEGGLCGAEQVAKRAIGAQVVKAFNTTGADNMAAPNYGDRRLTMLLAGDDESATQVASELARDIGFEPIVAGPLAMARSLEHMALVWIRLAFAQGFGPDFALQIERRPQE